MRQYLIYYKRGASKFSLLDPILGKKLYDRAEVNAGIQVLSDNPAFEGIVVRLEDEMFNVITICQEALAPNAIPFDGDTT